MRIWVDADACPGVIKDIIFRAAERTGVETTLVANQALNVPRSPVIRAIQVASGFDEADNWIADKAQAGDLVVTADIPLAAAVVAKNVYAINPRGELYTENNIRQRLAMRDLMDQIRANGTPTGGPPPLGNREKQAFANQLDRLLAKRD